MTQWQKLKTSLGDVSLIWAERKTMGTWNRMKVTMEMEYFAYILNVELIFAYTLKVGYKKRKDGFMYLQFESRQLIKYQLITEMRTT